MKAKTKMPAHGMEADGRRQSNAGPACMGGNPPSKLSFHPPRYKGGNQNEGKWESKTKKPAQGMEVEGRRQSKACGNAKCMGVTLPKFSFTPQGDNQAILCFQEEDQLCRAGSARCTAAVSVSPFSRPF